MGRGTRSRGQIRRTVPWPRRHYGRRQEGPRLVLTPQSGPSGMQPSGHVRPCGGGGAMKRKRFTEGQIGFALRQAEAGTPVEEVCRKMGVSEPTFYRWRRRFGGMGVPEIRRLRRLEEEN